MLHDTESIRTPKQQPRRTVFTPELPELPAIFQNDFLQGFIKHPERFPIGVKHLRFWECSKVKFRNATDIGFSFFSDEYQKPGDIIEVTITSKNEINYFTRTLLKRYAHAPFRRTFHLYAARLQPADARPTKNIVESISC